MVVLADIEVCGRFGCEGIRVRELQGNWDQGIAREPGEEIGLMGY